MRIKKKKTTTTTTTLEEYCKIKIIALLLLLFQQAEHLCLGNCLPEIALHLKSQPIDQDKAASPTQAPH